jgi:hypothetical protein
MKCRRSYCSNQFSDIIGGIPTVSAGHECVPCLYAVQMVSQGTTPEQVESIPEMMESFASLLEKTGWTWQHVKDSYARLSLLPSDVQHSELMM